MLLYFLCNPTPVLCSQIQKYSQFINFPIYLWAEKTIKEEVPIEEEESTEEKKDEGDVEEKDDEAEVRQLGRVSKSCLSVYT